MKNTIILFLLAILLVKCNNNKLEKKGLQVNEIIVDEEGNKKVGLELDSLLFETQPRDVLLTQNPEHRLTPIYKVNYDKNKEAFTGSNEFHETWVDKYEKGNNWNNHLIPGFEAVYGYNFVNISHYNNKTKNQNQFFEKPVMIKTLYYPTFSKDTLNFQPIKRNFYMVSVFDEDTNKDGFLNRKDLRRLYFFDINGQNKKLLVPKKYGVIGSSYDSGNDFIYITTQLDKNNNGKIETTEPVNYFWIDLKNPDNTGLQYSSE